MRRLFLILMMNLLFGGSPPKKRTWVVGDSEAGAVHSYLIPKLPNDQTILTYETSSRIEKWSGGKMAASRPAGQIDTVIVFLGTNNYYDQQLPSPKGVLDIVRSTGARCVWVGPPRVHNRPFPLNNDLRKAVENTCTYVDSQSLSIELRDGIHPTDKGAQEWAQRIVEAYEDSSHPRP